MAALRWTAKHVADKSAIFSFEDRERRRGRRRLVRRLFVGLTVVAAAAFLAAPFLLPASDHPGAAASLLERIMLMLSGFSGTLHAQVRDLSATVNQHTPAIALGLGVAALAVPLVVLGAVARWLAPDQEPASDGAEALSGSDEDAAVDVKGRPTTPVTPVVNAGDRTGHAWPARVWLVRDAATGAERHGITSELTRIGREADNEICIDGTGVDRYHAAISRTPEFDHYLVAISGDAACPTEVNGSRVLRQRLRHGDVIGIGEARLTFCAR